MSSALEIIGSSSIGRTSAPAQAAPQKGAPSAPTAPVSRTVNIVQDPAVGFITEYLSVHSGEIITQIPSAKTVAYLRQGLSPQGLPSKESMLV